MESTVNLPILRQKQQRTSTGGPLLSMEYKHCDMPRLEPGKSE